MTRDAFLISFWKGDERAISDASSLRIMASRLRFGCRSNELIADTISNVVAESRCLKSFSDVWRLRPSRAHCPTRRVAHLAKFMALIVGNPVIDANAAAIVFFMNLARTSDKFFALSASMM